MNQKTVYHIYKSEEGWNTGVRKIAEDDCCPSSIPRQQKLAQGREELLRRLLNVENDGLQQQLKA